MFIFVVIVIIIITITIAFIITTIFIIIIIIIAVVIVVAVATDSYCHGLFFCKESSEDIVCNSSSAFPRGRFSSVLSMVWRDYISSLLVPSKVPSHDPFHHFSCCAIQSPVTLSIQLAAILALVLCT